jgi:single-strand DNA-binding protein
MDFNKVIIAGRLTRDPEMKYLGSGTAFCVWGMATNRYYNDNNGERQQEVCFLDCKAFGRQAEIVANYVQKGNPLFVEGRLSFYQYETEDGEKRNKLSVIAERVQLLPKVNGNQEAPPMEEPKEAVPLNAVVSSPTPEGLRQPLSPQVEHPEADGEEQQVPIDDDVPF